MPTTNIPFYAGIHAHKPGDLVRLSYCGPVYRVVALGVSLAVLGAAKPLTVPVFNPNEGADVFGGQHHRCPKCGHLPPQHDNACPRHPILTAGEQQVRGGLWEEGYANGRSGKPHKHPDHPTYRLGWIAGDARADADANWE